MAFKRCDVLKYRTIADSPEERANYARNYLALRQRCRTDLLFLCNEVLAPPYSKIIVPHAHGAYIQHCQKFKGWREKMDPNTRKIVYGELVLKIDELHGSRDNLLVGSRGSLKTTIQTEAHAIQWILNFPDIRIGLGTASAEQNERVIGSGIKPHFQNNPRLRFLFPEFCPPPKKAGDWGSKTEFTVPARRRNYREPTIMGLSLGKHAASIHFDVLKFTDVVTEANTKTKGQIEEVKEWFGQIEPLRERYESKDGRPNQGWKDVEGTVYDFGDYHQMIIDHQRNLSPEQRTWQITMQSCWKDKANRVPMWPERFPASELDRILNSPEVGPYIFSCTPGDAKILMADFTEKPISEIVVGDEIIGYCRGTRSDGNRGALLPTLVTETNSRIAKVQKVFFEDGTFVRCTPEHNWYTGRSDESHPMYAPAKIGRDMIEVFPELSATADEISDWRYLAGIVDGEGACKHGGQVCIHQSLTKNPEVHAAIKDVLDRLRIGYSEYERDDKPGCTHFYLHADRSVRMKLLRFGKPAKRRQIIDGLLRCSSRIGQADKKPVRIEPDGEERVYALTTETGNYVSQGYASKNCQYELNPIVPGTGLATREQVKFFPAHIARQLQPRYRIATTIDLADITGTVVGGDNSAIVTGGFDADGRFDVLQIQHGHFTDEQIVERMFLVQTMYPTNAEFRIQKDQISGGLRTLLRREGDKRRMKGDPNWWLNIKYVAIPTNESKNHKIIRNLQGWFSLGLLRFSDAIDCKATLIDEILRFPKAPHDDILDALADQFHNAEGQPVDAAIPRQKSEVERQSFGHSDSHIYGPTLWTPEDNELQYYSTRTGI